MWYILRCHPEKEEYMMTFLRQHISSLILKNIFIFTYDRMKRYHGQWHIESADMFPDYIFLESDYERELSNELERFRDIVQAMEDGEILWKIDQEEERFLRTLGGREHHLGMSIGYINGGVTYVKEGPLKGMENCIRKIDRHKRIARLDVPLRHGEESLIAGLEIVEKS